MRQQHDSSGRAIHHEGGGHDQQTHGNRGGGAGEKGGREHHGGRDLPWRGMTAHTEDGTYQITKKGDGYALRYRGDEIASGMRSIDEAKAEAGTFASAKNIPTYVPKSRIGDGSSKGAGVRPAKKEGLKQLLKDMYHSIPDAVEDMFR